LPTGRPAQSFRHTLPAGQSSPQGGMFMTRTSAGYAHAAAENADGLWRLQQHRALSYAPLSSSN
jgi:hypothetical protein